MVARFAVPEAEQASWVARDPSISASEYVPRRGLSFINIKLNGETNDLCRILIDQSYVRMISKLLKHKRLVLELTQSQLSEDEILDRLIESCGLSEQSTSILGGAGRYQQQFPEDLRDTDLTVIATFGSEDLTQMSWGDGGDLTLLANLDDVRRGATTAIWTENQGG